MNKKEYRCRGIYKGEVCNRILFKYSIGNLEPVKGSSVNHNLGWDTIEVKCSKCKTISEITQENLNLNKIVEVLVSHRGSECEIAL